ncbi:MAG: metallophosphoesterase, partial [Lachnospiraceae bacterium]|nr:metallophosphoesterase [Lachnospiraceae bacterium]
MGDIHGFINELNTALAYINLDDDNSILVFLGDYIHGHDSYAVLDRVMALQEKYGSEKIVTLMGNHEEAVDVYGHELSEGDDVVREVLDDSPYRKWIHSLRKYYKTDKQIFVHAGIVEVEEEGEEYLWESVTPDHIFYGKYPPQKGHFYMDIIAGHTGTSTISGDPDFHGIFYDGASHYYIDGSVCESGEIPVLMYDTDTEKYYEITQ